MKWIKIASAAVNTTPLDWQGNAANCRAAIESAREQGVQVLCLPELAVSGYGCEDVFHSMAHARRAADSLLQIGAAADGMILGIGVPLRLQHGLYNCTCFFADGIPAGVVAKQHLAGDGVHYEPRWFRPWKATRVEGVFLGGTEVPFGDIVLDFGGIRVGAEICEDAWGPDRPGARLARAGCDLILNPSASHFSFGKYTVRERLVIESSRAYGCAYVYANLVGNESGRVVYDGERLIAANGEMVARGERFSFAPWRLTTAVVDVDNLRTGRGRTASFFATDEGANLVRVPWTWTRGDEPPAEPVGDPVDWNAGTHVKEEEFARAVSLGLFDYLRKSRSRGFVVSLSGGADSATVATMAALALQFPMRELGPEATSQRLNGLAIDASRFGGGLLDTVYQGSENSSETTRAAAEAVAEGLGSRHAEWKIDGLVTGYRERVEGALGRALTWQDDDIALQNIQARVRAPGVWMIANVRNALLLSTSNRSEAAVGYATMDGDTAGSLSPIAGIDKAFLRKWLRWMAETGPAGLKPVPELLAICEIPPTAELRPSSRNQTDEDDLMPYDLLDVIERYAVRDRLEPREILMRLEESWAEAVGGREALSGYIRKFFELWSRNQWKRERYAPSFHLDDESVDPKTWCRFPILSGSYRSELADMDGG